MSEFHTGVVIGAIVAVIALVGLWLCWPVEDSADRFFRRCVIEQIEELGGIVPGYRAEDALWCVQELRRLVLAADYTGMKERMAKLRRLLDTIEDLYGFECQGGPIANCAHWGELRALLICLRKPAESDRPDREWYAAKIRETLDDDFSIGPALKIQPDDPGARAFKAAQARARFVQIYNKEPEPVHLNRAARTFGLFGQWPLPKDPTPGQKDIES